jgi:YaiO family outer membrane protein
VAKENMRQRFTGSAYQRAAVLTLLAGLALPVMAAEQRQYIEANYVEAGLNYSTLTNGYADWRGIFVHGSWQQDKNNIWEAEVLRESEYDAWGTYVSAGLTHTFNDDWYASAFLGGSNDAFFFSKLRVDAFINRKLLKDKNLVATLGVGYEQAQEVNADTSLYVGASYYFEQPVEIEGGIRFNRSNPGPENSNRYRIAVTYGQPFKRYLIAEYDWGTEAYQFVSAGVSIMDFNSQLLTLTWREWMAKDWGFALRGEVYQSDEYNRNGVQISVFKHY